MPYTLLLADDSVTIQRVIELTFADEDVTVVAVSDGDQAIEQLEASPPDIVLADIGMPGKNGYEVAQYIRQSPRLAHIPVVLLTGAFEPVDQVRARETGCDGVLAKPFEPQLVIGRVKELLARLGPDGAGSRQDRGVAAKDAAAVDPSAAPAEDSSWAPPAGEIGALSSPAAAVAGAQNGSAPQQQLDDYFDGLDSAFSRLRQDARGPHASRVADLAVPPSAGPASDSDWLRATVTRSAIPEPWDLPAPRADAEVGDLPPTYASPQPATRFAMHTSFAVVDHAEPVPEEPVVVAAAPIVEPAAMPDATAVARASTAHHAPISGPDERLAPIEESAPIEPAASSAEPPLPAAPALPPLAGAFAALLAAERGEALPTSTQWPPQVSADVSDEVVETITRRVLERLSDTVVRQAVSEVASQIAERLIRDEIERIKAAIK